MKKHISLRQNVKFAVLALLCMTLMLGLSVQAKAANPKSVSLKTGTVYTKYDITGDGKADKIRIVKSSDNRSLYIYINDKVAYSFVNQNCNGSVFVKLYTLKNRKVIVYVAAYQDGGGGPVCALFRYKSGKLKKLTDFQSFFPYGNEASGQVTKVSGNTLRITVTSMSWALGSVDMQYTLKYKNGTLVPTSRTGKVIGYRSQSWLTAKKNIQLYTGAASSKKAFVLKKGTLAKVTNCYIKKTNVRFKIKLANGKTGWLKAPKKALSDGKGLFNECWYAG